MTTSPAADTTLTEAMAALAKGEAAQALEILAPVIAAGRADASTWLAAAHARGLLGDRSGKLAAIDAALALAPNDLRALLAKGDHLVAEGDERGASSFYAAALQYLPRLKSLPPALQEGLRRAQALQTRVVRELEDFVRARLEASGIGEGERPRRFAQAVDIMFGRKQVYLQAPRYFYYPGLPQLQFYERSAFPWLDAIEAATDAVREELLGVIGAAFTPYVTHTPGRPWNDQAGMADNPDWTAFFMFKDGAEQPGAARCPRTVATLAEAPLTRISNRTPSVLFSKLAAGAHIPPHTGMLNARLIVHLPLIVPPGCEFRVGNDVRAWEEGKAWVFDDSIEHEAWNRSDRDRYILLFDIWRPELSLEERACVAALCAAIEAYRGGGGSWDA